MMTNLTCDVIKALKGKTLVTAESCTGGGIGAALTSVPGSSAVFKGGIICYTNWVKENILEVNPATLKKYGAVSIPVAAEMALAGPDGDEFGNPVGTVCIGYSSNEGSFTKQFRFSGNREEVRNHAIHAALTIVLEMLDE